MTEQVTATRDSSGKFLPGAPGGPGRPKKPSQSERMRSYLEPHAEMLLTEALALAKSADPKGKAQGLRICLERLAGAPRQQLEPVEIPGIAAAKTVAEKAECILIAMGHGDVSPEAGEKLMRMLDIVGRVVQLSDLEARIKRLETGGRVIEPEDGGGLV